jgi:apolipoprotein N-acyltransferase
VTPLIQIADVTGEYGVSFFVAMVNGAVVDRLAPWVMQRGAADSAATQAGRGILSRSLGFARVGEIATIAAGTFLLLYGAYRLSETTRTEGPVIGLVQGAFPIALQKRDATAESILDFHLKASGTLLPAKGDGNARGPELVIWPETMLPGGMNADVLNVNVEKMDPAEQRRLLECFGWSGVWGEKMPNGTVQPYPDWLIRDLLRLEIAGGVRADGTRSAGRRAMAAQVRAMATELGCPILAGGATFHPNLQPLDEHEGWLKRNSALWIEPNSASGLAYSKMHLVPFSEYVPFRDSWTGLHKLLRMFVPGVMPQLQPGRKVTVFELERRGGGKWRLVAPICYEGTFSRVCRGMAGGGGVKAADIIANISNDGWFVCPWGRERRGSSEQAQHLAHYCYRAVENRCPVVRSVNTGISASVDSTGRIVATVSHPAQPSLRTMVSGTLELDGRRKNEKEFAHGHGPKVLVDSRVSGYSRVGDLFAAVVFAAAAGMAVRLAWRRAGKLEGAGH